ncbi:sensor histidine kinase [Ktedonobacter racemifer]|uniref:histidine kinase n=1 Tax=Ktedonobacter racemifer DSM 44963 TaxID=485913 RepID=D6TWF4_KTERA|nr:HAMP domain-containing sensor histidine kinase [Ktedonobacter racemifer]EFH84537.1 integral membrane sensor signal transduction histidine kinase [Ktedonobacter racemifer DSM 44963]
MIERLQQIRPPGIRVQLTLWYTAIFTLLILLFSLIFYTTLYTFLASGLDSALQLRAQQIAGGVSNDSGNIVIQDVTGELPGLDATATPENQGQGTTKAKQLGSQSDVNFGTLVRILDAKGQTTYISPAFHALSLPSNSFTSPLHGSAWQGTLTAHNGQAVRVYSVALSDNGTVFGVLQVGESLTQLTSTLQSVAIVLLVITPFMLLLGAIGSYWLAKRAFRPVLYLTRTTREIEAGDLHRRVPIPRARDEVHELALTFNEMIGRLEQAFTQQRRFVADASHELRTPVAVIRSFTDVALEEPRAFEECITALREINAESERLGHLINDLLSLARADEEQMPIEREPVRLDLLTLDVCETMELLAIERGIDLQVQKIAPATIQGDTVRLIQVIMGVVDNALTYTNAGGKVTLSVETHALVARLVVRDTGIGIAEQDIPHIFERFYRADPVGWRAARGSGLGLSIADWVVRAHGGSIDVESQVGRGTTFTITLPLASPTSVQTHRE